MGRLIGYGALISEFELRVPLPDRLAITIGKHKQYSDNEWQVFGPRYQPEDNLGGHLVFALKYEGVDLGVLKALFVCTGAGMIRELVAGEPTGQYSRRIWFLYEWLMNTPLDLPDLTSGNYVDVLDEHLQFGGSPEVSRRHRVRNTLPGVRDFCPLVRKTSTIGFYQQLELPREIRKVMGKIPADVMSRAAAFLLLKDSKASYAIEGESPIHKRAHRWAVAIGQAGQHSINTEEMVRLQEIVIDNPRFTRMGLRQQEGFIGEHDRNHGTPIPDHISARYKDLEVLIPGLITTEHRLEENDHFDAVVAAAMVAFGFVFIHPFVDGNGRIHRYLVHHTLIRKKYVPPGIIFPVSAIILERLDEYRRVLEHFSRPRVDLIEWRPTTDNNVEVLNETIDLYRYFDATKFAEFLYQCVHETIEKTIPAEVDYLEKYDRMKAFLDNYVEMPDKTVALLVRFLEQGSGILSKRARSNEFVMLTDDEVTAIEKKYGEIFEQIKKDNDG